MHCVKPLRLKTIYLTIAVALVVSTAAMGIGRSVLGTHVTADASRIAAADLDAMPVLVLGVER